MVQAAGISAVVHVVDDDKGMRSALSTLLKAAGYEVRTYASAQDFLLARPGSAPGCVILDVRMPGESGLDMQQAFAADDAPLPVVFLTAHGDIPMSVRAVRAGAVDFLTKPVKRATLLAAVDTALARDAEQRAQREGLRAVRSRYDSLTARERQVFALVVTGKLNKQTAGDLGIAERTVKVHRGRVMEKMQVASLAELVHIAGRLGLGLAGPSTTPGD
jgi:two-component system, LuxR family, response regulator FixJ